MAIPNSSGVAIGNNPFSFAAPLSGGKSLFLDIALSNVAALKVVMDAADQLAVDNKMLILLPDAKEKLGGNATAAVSAAVLKAGAAALGIPLYQHIGGAGAMLAAPPTRLSAPIRTCRRLNASWKRRASVRWPL